MQRWVKSRLFVPMLAGATLRERLVACLGALIGIGLTALICSLLFGTNASLPILVAPMGASAVLLFAVPTSPLAQPWSIVGGNTISALVGVAVAQLVAEPVLAAALGVSLAIAAMSFTRSLHPPGGASALTAVLGGPAVASMGFLYPFIPVALNSMLLLALGFIFHKLSRRGYPHMSVPVPVNTHGTLDPPAQLRVGFREEDVDAALATLGETFDINRNDLDRLLREVELQTTIRSHRTLLCEDVMSRDVIYVDAGASVLEARALLLDHNIRTLPVVDTSGRLAGTVGLRELTLAGDDIRQTMSTASTAAADDPALSLLPALTDGRTHAVVIVDDDHFVLGLITQTDLLAAMARMPLLEPETERLEPVGSAPTMLAAE
ncbi:HPP family protein [Pseudaminobacter sp. NGMCC 1.201702]|uniref:HPP family protein n=1 Tax=Pseudaminobacter sp. NGMCC 1.201702 TaxID=3391825 RepID=UPI0039F04F39